MIISSYDTGQLQNRDFPLVSSAEIVNLSIIEKEPNFKNMVPTSKIPDEPS